MLPFRLDWLRPGPRSCTGRLWLWAGDAFSVAAEVHQECGVSCLLTHVLILPRISLSRRGR